MKDTAPKGLGILAVAIVFGIIGAGVAFVMWDFGAVGAFVIGLIVAAIVAILLLLGWREPAGGSTHAASPSKSAAPTAPAASTAAPAAAATATASPKVEPEPAETAAAATIVEPTVAETPDSPEPPAAAATTGDDAKPEMLSAPRDGGADDLKQIKGVGPKLEKLLNTMGVYHFDQVASWEAREVAWVDENLEGFKGRVSRDNWVAQAKTLAAGGTTEFSKKVKKGGVY